jgi:hypothetical protein
MLATHHRSMAVREEMRGVVDEDLQHRVSNIRTFLGPAEGAARGNGFAGGTSHLGLALGRQGDAAQNLTAMSGQQDRLVNEGDHLPMAVEPGLFNPLANRFSIALTACCAIEGVTCEYRSSVIPTDACPSISDTTFVCTPCAAMRVAAVWRRS